MRMRLALAMVALSCRLAVLGTSGLADWISLSHDMADVRVEGGVLKGRVTGRDPFFRVRLKEPFAGTADHVLRIKARATHLGEWNFFWRSEGNGRFGSPDILRFRIDGTNEWQTLELRPFWSGEGNILEMRLDVPEIPGCEVEVAEIACVDKPSGFRPVKAEEASGVVFEAAADAITYGAITWHVTGSRGEKLVPFTTAADGAVHSYWFDHYFNTDEYLKIDGRPVVVIYTGYELKAKFGEAVARGFLEAAQDCARKAGFPGIHFVAQRGSSDPALAAELASLGFERMSVYKYLADDVRAGRWTSPRDYEQVVATSLAHWRHVHGTSPIKFFPSLSTGYDPRPWIGAVNNVLVTNVTSRGFRRICEDARRFSDETGERYLLVGPLDEWGEGSIGYPNRQHGFGMLEAVRDTFGEKPDDGWPVNIAPEDVGLKCPSRKEL